MASFQQIREGIADNLRTLRFTSGAAPAVHAYMVSNLLGPAIQVFPGPATYDLAMHRGLDETTWVVQAVVPFTTDQGSQVLLDELCAPTGTSSIKTAVEKKDGPNGEVTLGGTVASVRVTGMSGYRVVNTDSGTTSLLVAEWDVTVYSS